MKALKSLLLCILTTITIFSFSSCSFLFAPSNQESSIQEKETKTTISVYNDDIKTDFEVYYEKQAQITPFVKPGYYLSGYYTEPEGGEKYFDLNGKSTQVWQKNMPNTFYAQWKPISELNFTGKTLYSDEPKTLSFYSVACYYTLPDEFINAIKGNLKEDFTVTLHFKAKEKLGSVISNYAPLTIRVQDGKGDGASVYGKQTLTPPNEYKSYDLSFTVEAESFKKGIIYVVFDLGYAYVDLYLKDVYVTASFN